MKDAWNNEINNFEGTHRRKVTKGDFTEVFGKAFITAFTKDTILAAFEKTGIHPFNPNIITLQQMKPSEATTIQGSFHWHKQALHEKLWPHLASIT
jgi:hypothetical protein